MLNLTLENKIVLQEKVVTDSIEAIRIEDNYRDAMVTAYIKVGETLSILNLWQNDEYYNIGQWSDVDVENRIRELVSAQYTVDSVKP
jgi:hypothetical protein